MMTLLLTAALTFAVVIVALLVFLWIGAPVYRLGIDNLIQLLELVVAGEASESDWQVFCAYAIHHDLYLAAVQQRCLAIDEQEYIGSQTAGNGLLFSAEGQHQLAGILEELKHKKEGK